MHVRVNGPGCLRFHRPRCDAQQDVVGYRIQSDIAGGRHCRRIDIEAKIRSDANPTATAVESSLLGPLRTALRQFKEEHNKLAASRGGLVLFLPPPQPSRPPGPFLGRGYAGVGGWFLRAFNEFDLVRPALEQLLLQR